MKPTSRHNFLAVALVGALAFATTAVAQTAPNMKMTTDIPPEITTPDSVETHIGRLEFKDGAPTSETVEKVYDSLDFMHASEAFLNAFRGASLVAARKGFINAGIEDNAVIIFSEMMDSKTLFLTPNADTPYFISFIDLSKGPMVVETPPLSARRLRRHVVPLGHRLRPAGPGPGRGRKISAAAARLHRRPARQRLPRGAIAHDPSAAHGPVFPRQQRPEAAGRIDQEDAQDLSLSTRGLRHEHRHGTRGQGSSASLPRWQAGLGISAAAAAGEVRRRQRQGDEHDSAQRLQLLRDHRRAGSGGARGRHGPGGHGISRSDRHRQGQAVRPRCADARNSDGCRRNSERDCTGARD